MLRAVGGCPGKIISDLDIIELKCCWFSYCWVLITHLDGGTPTIGQTVEAGHLTAGQSKGDDHRHAKLTT